MQRFLLYGVYSFLYTVQIGLSEAAGGHYHIKITFHKERCHYHNSV
jgi:hypothetical protein